MATSVEAVEQILRFTDESKVVPIIGPALSVIESGGERTTVEQFLAKALAEKYEIAETALPANYTLNDVVCAYPDFTNELSIICAELRDILKNAALPVPDPLRKMARISAFHLFVTTSFDGLLQRALEEERGDIQTLTYFPQSKTDYFEENLRAGRRGVLFELFGHITSMEDQFVLTEDDLLEFAHHLQSRPPDAPHNLLQKTGDAHLLFIGNGFPDWLARFFLRTIKHQRNRSNDRRYREYIVDSKVRRDGPLMEFVKYFSRRTTVVDTEDAIGFVDELYNRWAREHPEPPNYETAVKEGVRGGSYDQQKAVVFLSYAREDRSVALRIKDSLEKIGWTVWFDKAGGLDAGDEYDEKIRRAIKGCQIFMPVLSRKTSSPIPGEGDYFRREWSWAKDKKSRFEGHPWRPIIPILVDDSAELPEVFGDVDRGPRAVDGDLSAAFLETMKRKLRELRSGKIEALPN